MPDPERPSHHADNHPDGKEAGLDYTVNSADKSLSAENRRTVNYLVHRMLWDQQEKIGLDDLSVSAEGGLDVRDEP